MRVYDGWPRTVYNGTVRELLYRIDADAGDCLTLPDKASEVQCTEIIEFVEDSIIFKHPTVAGYCRVIF